MFPEYEANWHHQLICEKLEAVNRGEVKRLMIFMPPRHGKSMLASEFFPAWFLGQNPKKEIISCSYNDELAEEFSRKVRKTVKSDKYKFVFDTTIDKDTRKISRWALSNGSGYRAAGVGGGITGRGANIFIIDDPVKNQEEANSPTTREKIWNWYTSDVRTRLAKGGAIILVMTRWHDDDLAGRLLKKDKKRWDIINFPAIATKDEDHRLKGEALWPSMFSLEELSEIKGLSRSTWGSLYQQNPILSETQDFKQRWFKKWKDLPSPLRRFTLVDPAISKKKRADNSAILTIGVDVENNIYVLEYTADHLDPSELIDEVFRQAEKWNSEKVGIESVQYQRSIEHFMTLEMKRRGKYLNIICLDGKANKEERIRGLIPYYKLGMVHHPFDSEVLEEELIRFPSGRHDDVLDALSMGLKIMQPPKKHMALRPLVRYSKKTGAVIGTIPIKNRI